MEVVPRFFIAVLGSSGVGKQSLLRRICTGGFHRPRTEAYEEYFDASISLTPTIRCIANFWIPHLDVIVSTIEFTI